MIDSSFVEKISSDNNEDVKKAILEIINAEGKFDSEEIDLIIAVIEPHKQSSDPLTANLAATALKKLEKWKSPNAELVNSSLKKINQFSELISSHAKNIPQGLKSFREKYGPSLRSKLSKVSQRILANKVKLLSVVTLMALLTIMTYLFAVSGGIDSIKKSAEQGNAEAQYKLASAYLDGKDVPYDLKETVKWAQKAADQGHRDAQAMLGRAYFYGHGVPKDYQKAYDWLVKAAEQECADAQFFLGTICEAVERHNDAVEWYKKGAENGHADCQCNLGSYYSQGKVITQDHNKAVMLWQKGAEQGHSDCQTKLGIAFSDGEGVAQDYKEAVKWFKKAAEQGNPGGQMLLGLAFYEGKGVTQDYAEAYFWQNLAVSQNSDYAGFRNKTAAKLSSSEIEDIQTRCKRWQENLEKKKALSH